MSAFIIIKVDSFVTAVCIATTTADHGKYFCSSRNQHPASSRVHFSEWIRWNRWYDSELFSAVESFTLACLLEWCLIVRAIAAWIQAGNQVINRDLARLDFCSFSDLEVSNITTQREVKWLGKLSQKQSREPHQITSNIIWRWWGPFQCAIAHAVVAIGSGLCEQITRTRTFCPMETWPWRPTPPVPATSENSVNFLRLETSFTPRQLSSALSLMPFGHWKWTMLEITKIRYFGCVKIWQ